MGLRASRIAVLAGAALALSVSVVHAAIVVQEGPGGGNAGTDNVIFNSCSGTASGPALTVQGCLNSDNSTIIDFTSNENLVADGGQARVEADDDRFNTLQINVNPLATSSFTALIFNIITTDDEPRGTDEGTVLITVQLAGGGSTVLGPFDIDSAGQNFFRIDATLGDEIQSVSFTTSDIFIADVRQVRLGIPGEDLPAVPEPSTVMLLGFGVMAIGVAVRRKIRA